MFVGCISRRGFAFTYPCPRKLRQIVQISMFERESTHKVESIWSQYHSERPANISSSLDRQKYAYLKDRASQAPLFLLPVGRQGGHFKLLTQWQTNCFLCTYLQDYKRWGTNASPYVVFTLFDELLFKKGVVLVRGDVLNNSLTKLETQKLWSLLEAAYTEPQPNELVYQFNKAPTQFSMEKFNQYYRLE